MLPPSLLLSEQCDKSSDHFYKGRKLNVWSEHAVQWEGGDRGAVDGRGELQSRQGTIKIGDLSFF